MDGHSILDAVASLGIIAIGSLLWKVSSRFTQVATRLEGLADDVRDIRTNHLPHLQDDLTNLRDRFIDHIENNH